MNLLDKKVFLVQLLKQNIETKSMRAHLACGRAVAVKLVLVLGPIKLSDLTTPWPQYKVCTNINDLISFLHYKYNMATLLHYTPLSCIS